MTKWKKPAKPSNTFADALKIIGLKPYNTTHYVWLDGLITSNKFKMKLAESINTYFREFRGRRAEIASNPKQILEILEKGREKVSKRAKNTLEDVRHAMHIDYENQFKS